PGARITATVRRGAEHSVLGLIARPAPRSPAEVIGAAARAARDADVAVVVVGLTEEQETEGLDKSTLALPGEQDAMVAAVAGVAHGAGARQARIHRGHRRRVSRMASAGLPGAAVLVRSRAGLHDLAVRGRRAGRRARPGAVGARRADQRRRAGRARGRAGVP